MSGQQTDASLIAELRGFAEGSMSARASLMRDAADAIERLCKHPEPEWEYGVYDPAQNEVESCGTDPVTRSSFTGIDWDATGEYIVRRRGPGPWAPAVEDAPDVS